MNLRRVWKFLWNEDSLTSWIVNLVIAIILVKFVIYPGVGLLLGTSYPVVAVISTSMEHGNLDFEEWWELNEEFYEKNGITREEFEKFDFKNGFNKGDIFVVRNDISKISEGDVIVYNNLRQKTPIIHRVIDKELDEGGVYFVSKGDNVGRIQDFEKNIKGKQILGKAVLKVPFLGWLKVWFSDYIAGPYCRIIKWPC